MAFGNDLFPSHLIKYLARCDIHGLFVHVRPENEEAKCPKCFPDKEKENEKDED